jgi:anti-sigma-K factor RskA
MNVTTRGDVEALLGAYALDAVSEDERRAVERFLETDEGLRNELDQYRSVAAVLAQAVDPVPSTPSPGVWDGIRAAIAGTTEVDASPTPLTPTRELRKQRWFSWAAVAVSVAAVIVSVGLGIRVVDLQQRLDDQQTEESLAAAVQAALADPSSTVATMRQPEGAREATASVVLGSNGVGYVYSDTLPALAADRTYQLWAIVDGRVISAGILGADPAISPFQVVGDVDGFAITDEVAGGVVTSENEAVAVWLDA